MKLNSNTLTFEQTERFKGLLILLIVFGHISQLLEQFGSLHATLYSFHVVSFLFLPFLFNSDQVNRENITKNLRRIYIPYTIFFTLSLIAFSLLQNEFNPLSALRAWALGTSYYLKMDIGFRLFWFFPTLLFTILLIMIFNTLSKRVKRIFLAVMLLLHIIIPFIPKSYLFLFPFSAYISFYLFIIGIIVSYIYKYCNYTQLNRWIYLLLFLTLLTLAYGSDFSLASAIFPNPLTESFNFFLQDLIMIVSFFTLIVWSKNIRFLETFGKYSLAIFTIHPFIIQLLNKLYSWETPLEGVIKFLLVILLAYLIARVIYFFKINKIIYPR